MKGTLVKVQSPRGSKWELLEKDENLICFEKLQLYLKLRFVFAGCWNMAVMLFHVNLE